MTKGGAVSDDRITLPERRYRMPVGVHLLVVRSDGCVLLGLRRDTGWGDMRWHVPAGHLTRGETMVAAGARVAREDLRVEVEPHDLQHAVTVDHCEGPDYQARLEMFFIVERWEGTPINAERHRCARLEWHAMTALPLRTIGYTRAAIETYAAGESYVTCWRGVTRTRPVERELGIRVIDGLVGL